MNTSSVALLLQMAASLLAGVQNNPSIPRPAAVQAVAVAGRAVQVVAQAEAKIGFAVPQNNGIWPNVGDLMQSAYRTENGSYAPQGDGVVLDQPTISFGDLNGDGFDDAAAIVEVGNGTSARADLAMFLNQGGVMFNIADLPLGASTTVYFHEIADGVLTINMKTDGRARATSTYMLVGERIMNVR